MSDVSLQRNIQRIGLSSEYKDKSGEISKWLSKFVGLPFLLPEEVADAFVEDIKKCLEFADYVLNNYIEEIERTRGFSLNIFYLPIKQTKWIRHKLNKLMKSSPNYNMLQ
jgi:hypothetical protein